MSVFKFKNNASAKLSTAILSGDTALTVVAGQGALFPTLTGGDTFRATLQSSTALEIISVTARSTDAFTIVRAQEGTSAVAFAAGDLLELRLTEAVMESFVQRTEADADVTTLDSLTDVTITSVTDLDVLGYNTGGTDWVNIHSTGTGTVVRSVSPALTTSPTAPTQTAGDNSTKIATTAYADNAVAKQPEVFMIAISDETTALTTGADKITFRMPFACSMTIVPRANVNTVSSSGNPEFDIEKNGTTIFATTLTIDASEKTSVTATTSAALTSSPTTFADDDEITIDILTAGTGTKGAKITMYVVRT